MIRSMILALWAALLLVGVSPARAEWRAHETAHFIIYSESDQNDVTRLAERLETIDRLMRMATGLGDAVQPVKVRIYEVASNEEVQRALGVSGTGIAGFYSSNSLGPFAVTPRKTYFQTGSFTPELILHHEYAHHFMLQYFPANYPSWYVEGFAELIGASTFMKDGRIAYGMPARHRGDGLLQNWVSVSELLAKRADKVPPYDVYGQGWAMAHFFTFSDKRAPQLRQYLAALQAGRSRAEAAKVFGDLDELNREARRYVGSGSFTYKPVPVEISRPAIVTSRTLSAAEAALVPEVIAFSDNALSGYRKPAAREREEKSRLATLEKLREKARYYANDPFANHLLAEAEYGAGNYPASEAAADRVLALDPNHSRGLVRKALAMSRNAQKLSPAERAARAGEARRFAIAANKADPTDPLPLLAYYEAYRLAGEKPTRDAVDGLVQAVGLLPRDSSIRLLLVDQLASEKRWAEAIAVLMPISSSPHNSPQRDAAQEQMAKLQAELVKAQGGSEG